jgi:hypothetical protein
MRDAQKDLEMCEKATPGPWEWNCVEFGCGSIKCPRCKEIEDAKEEK